MRGLGPGVAIVELTRYQAVTAEARTLLQAGVSFHLLAGNLLIVLSAIAPSGWTNAPPNLQLLFAQPMLTDRAKNRAVLLCPVSELHLLVPLLERQGLEIEHIYDY